MAQLHLRLFPLFICVNQCLYQSRLAGSVVRFLEAMRLRYATVILPETGE
jgi:hypothetical protein